MHVERKLIPINFSFLEIKNDSLSATEIAAEDNVILALGSSAVDLKLQVEFLVNSKFRQDKR
jgi:hypothetical protein